MTRYDPSYLEALFDRYGEREWERLERTPADEVPFHIHRHYLRRFVRVGDRVLEAGAHILTAVRKGAA